MMPSASEDVAEEPWLELFVPGRICIMGEHSDWAGGFRALDPNITEGYCLVSGTEQVAWLESLRRGRGYL